MFNTTYKFPAISVIIPLYNVEKYVGQCLGSLLSQTFQDFEVIVVDDCSTDNSIEVVKKYIPNFKNRLQIIKLDKNSGNAALPRNMGLRLSRGKYISFIDPDDLIVKNAFEILYNIAESTQAEVVHSERYLAPIDEFKEIDSDTKFKITTFLNGPFVDKNTYLSNNLADRIIYFSQNRFLWSSCTKFYLRDFLNKNDIKFPKMLFSEDMPFCFYCLCLAEKYILTPNVFYVYRPRKGSATHLNLPLNKHIQKYLNTIIIGTQILDDFMSNIDFFNENSKYKFIALDFFVQWHLKSYLNETYLKNSVYDIDSITREVFSSLINKNSAFMSYFFNMTNIFRIQLIQSQRKILELQPPPLKL